MTSHGGTSCQSGLKLPQSERIPAAPDRLFNQFLTEVDGISSNCDIFVIASTTRPDVIDKTLLRPSRFFTLLFVPLPECFARRQILDSFVKKCVLEEDVDLDELSELMAAMTASQIEALCDAAFSLAGEELSASMSSDGNIVTPQPQVCIYQS